MANPLTTMGSNGGATAKLYAATAGAAFGEIVTAVLTNGVGLEWWPGPPTTVLLAYTVGYFVPNKRPSAGEGG